ncbi:MAG: hypothetical protein ACLFU0_06365 [Alphaproteobacteria bacterium]
MQNLRRLCLLTLLLLTGLGGAQTVEQLQQENQALRQQIAGLEAQLAQPISRERAAEIQQARNLAVSEAETLREQVAALSGRQNGLLEQIQNLRDQFGQARRELAASEEARAGLDAELSEVRAERDAHLVDRWGR